MRGVTVRGGDGEGGLGVLKCGEHRRFLILFSDPAAPRKQNGKAAILAALQTETGPAYFRSHTRR